MNTVQVELHDANEHPLAGVEVTLQRVLPGHDEAALPGQRARSDEVGRVTWSALEAGRGVVYTVEAFSGPAIYSSGPFELNGDKGQKVLLHLYPATVDVGQARIAVQAVAYVVPHDDVFQWEFLLRVFNWGRVAWVSRDTRLVLPESSQGIEFERRTPTLDWQSEAGSARLIGTVSPGKHEALLKFQVRNRREDPATFRFGLPSGILDLEVVAEAVPGMGLIVPGLPAAQKQTGRGQKLLVVRQQATRDAPITRELTVMLSGIPMPGPARWFAVAAVLILVLWGAWPVSRRSRNPLWLPESEAREARKLLLDELVMLERARLTDEVGIGTYESVRGRLLRALSGLVGLGAGRQGPQPSPKSAVS